MHPSYFNNPLIRDAWNLAAKNNRDAESVRDRHIRVGLIVPATADCGRV